MVLFLQEQAKQEAVMFFAMAFRFTVRVMPGEFIVTLHRLVMLVAYPVAHHLFSLTASRLGELVTQWIVDQW
ncbi:hypothetical protein BOO34_00600 [Vibrio navarrensis]|nr:hypothetical protein [Vibrio navarrensis]